MIDEKRPIIFIATKDKFFPTVKGGIEQVISRYSSLVVMKINVVNRNSKPILLCSEGNDDLPDDLIKLKVPATEDCLQVLLNIVPLQLLAYHIAVLLVSLNTLCYLK